MDEKYIYYLGADNRIENSLQRIKKKEPFLRISLKFIEFYEGKDLASIFLQLLETPPQVLFLELSNFDQNLKSFLLLMKSHTKLCDIRYFIVFQDRSDLKLFQDIYSFGMEYGFIQGDELDNVLLDAIYLSINPQVKLPKYAMADSLYLESYISSFCKVGHFTDDTVYLETHQAMELGKIVEVGLNFVEDLKVKYAKVIKKDPFSPLSCFFHSLGLMLLFKEARELKDKKDSKDICRKQAYLRLIESIKWKTRTENKKILIVDQRKETFAEVMGFLGSEDYSLKIRNVFSRDPYIVKSFKPDLIVFQQDDDPNPDKNRGPFTFNGKDAFKSILLQVSREVGYRPFIFIFNEKQNSEIFRNNYHYQRIIANKKNFETSLIPTMMSYNLHIHQKAKPIYFLNSSDKASYAQIRLKIFITMISEHIITFFHESELPFYTTFKFHIYSDRELYLTVIPPSFDLPQKKGMVSHMAVITNMTEKDKMEIRKLVNYLISLNEQELLGLELKSVEKLREENLDNKIKQLQQERDKNKKS